MTARSDARRDSAALFAWSGRVLAGAVRDACETPDSAREDLGCRCNVALALVGTFA